RDLRVQPRRERPDRLQVGLVRVAVDLAHRIHALVRVDADAGEEVIREGAHRAPADLVLDADDRLRDPVPLVLEEQHLDRIAHLVAVPLGHVLEHVTGREFELTFLGGGVVGAPADELVELEHLVARLREPDRGVDDAPVDRVLERAHSLNTRSAFSRRNLGHTWSRNGTPGSSAKIRSRVSPIGKYPAYMTLSAPRVFAKSMIAGG